MATDGWEIRRRRTRPPGRHVGSLTGLAGWAQGRDEGTPHAPNDPEGRSGSITLLTIGYQRRSVEDYLDILSDKHVTLLCDVRRNAISRNRGFSKSALARACEQIGIRYEHLPDLGIDAGRRRLAQTARGRQRLLAEYRRDDLAQMPVSLEKIVRWAASGERVAVTCFERVPSSCHRSLVAAEVERLGGANFTTEHLE